MIDLEKVKIAKEWMNALANGYNPLDGTALDDKDIVNNTTPYYVPLTIP